MVFPDFRPHPATRSRRAGRRLSRAGGVPPARAPQGVSGQTDAPGHFLSEILGDQVGPTFDFLFLQPALTFREPWLQPSLAAHQIPVRR